MALVLADRVQETSTTSGTGTFTLAGAVSGFTTFSSAVGNTNTTYYVAYDQTAYLWEVGIGTVGAGTLSRDTILSNSSGTTAKISFVGNVLNVWCDYPASRAVYEQGDGSVVLDVASSSAALRITQTGAGNALVVEDSANPDATPFVIDASGRVGIGTAPLYAVDGLSIASSGSFAPQVFVRSSSNDGSASYLNFEKVRSTAIVQNGDDLGAVAFRGFDGAQQINAAWIYAEVDGTPGTNDMPGRLVFSTTADGASSPTERMRIDSAGRVGIGSIAAAFARFQVAGTLPSSSAFSYGISSAGTVPSTSTSGYVGFDSAPSTQATAFTLAALTHFQAYQSALGAGSTVTTQYGFHANSTLTGATNNYGFYSNIASGTGRWNFYAAGTAANYFAGAVGIGVAASAGQSLRVAKAITGAIYSTGVISNAEIQSDVTARADMFLAVPYTNSSAFTLTRLVGYYAQAGTVGAGSTVSNAAAFEVNSNWTFATNNYGFYSNIASGTGRYNFYAAGTAANYFAGSVTSNSTVQGSAVAASNGIFVNSNTVSADYTIPTNYNASSAGPVTVASGITVTVPSGSNWVIV